MVHIDLQTTPELLLLLSNGQPKFTCTARACSMPPSSLQCFNSPAGSSGG